MLVKNHKIDNRRSYQLNNTQPVASSAVLVNGVLVQLPSDCTRNTSARNPRVSDVQRATHLERRPLPAE